MCHHIVPCVWYHFSEVNVQVQVPKEHGVSQKHNLICQQAMCIVLVLMSLEVTK